jgi:DNA-binding Lrp family transcriptional regulator
LPTSFVLVKAKSGQEKEIIEKLIMIPEISERYTVFGKYDFLLKIEGKNHKKTSKMVATKIRLIDGIKIAELLPGKRINIKKGD